MKALEILKRFSDRRESAHGRDRSYVATLREINEAIAELEAKLPNTEQLSCDGCTHEKQSSPLFIHCLGCNRAKHLKDKFHDINEPCRG